MINRRNPKETTILAVVPLGHQLSRKDATYEQELDEAQNRLAQLLAVYAGTEPALAEQINAPLEEQSIALSDVQQAIVRALHSNAQSGAASRSSSLLSDYRHRSRHRRGMPSPMLKP